MYINNQAFKHFSWAFLAILLISSPLFLTEKSFLNIWINRLHNPFLDEFFKYITYLGSGWVLIPLLLFTLSRNYFLSLALVASFIFESLIVQLVLKQGFFSEVMRPIAYISNSNLLHKVEGVILYSMHSFPSGHTQTVFLVFTILVLMSKRISLAYIFLFIAILVGLSRIYLLQHFFIDVWFGAVIGYIFPVIIICFLSKYFESYTNPNKKSGAIRFRRKRNY